MKKRNTTIFAFLLLAAVGMGVGYAALTQDLGVKGNVNINQEQAQKEFSMQVKYVDNDEKITYLDAKGNAKAANSADKVSYDGDLHNATWTINTLAAKGETGKITLTVTNESDVAATISADSTKISNNGSTYFTVAHTLTDNTPLAVGASITFDVTIKMENDYTSETAGSFEFTFGFIVTSEEI